MREVKQTPPKPIKFMDLLRALFVTPLPKKKSEQFPPKRGMSYRDFREID